MKKALVKQLEDLCGQDRVYTKEEDLEHFSADALGPYRAFRAASQLGRLPDAVVCPRSAEEVSRLLAFASKEGIPVVPYGGGTGVMGGASPVKGGIVLALKGLRRIVRVSPEDRVAVVEAGVVLEELEVALNGQGLLLGHDPWSLPIATVGGAISTNGVGYRAGKYGVMGDQVLGLQAVLASGQVIATKGVPKQAAGPDLTGLFIGSEGTLAVITEATLQVFPLPEKRSLYTLRFPTFEKGFEAVVAMHSLGLRPAMVDFAEQLPAEGTPDYGAAQVELNLGFEGFKEEVEAQERRALEMCLRHDGRDLGQEAAKLFWENRHATAHRYKQEVLDRPPGRRRRRQWRMDYLHVALPTSRVLEFRSYCQRFLGEGGISAREWSIWGRPEFFSFMIADPEPPGAETSLKMAAVVDHVLMAAQDMGGTMEYCHGVGLKLSHLMEREMGTAMGALRAIKSTLDPQGILNPSKLGL